MQFIGSIGRHFDEVSGAVGGGGSHIYGLRNHRLVTEIHGAQQGNFFIGIGRFHRRIYEPRRSEGGVILQGRILSSQNDVPGVEGIQNRSSLCHPVTDGLQVFGLVELLVKAVDFSGEVVLNEVLVALELGGRITADVLVMVAGHRGIEHVYRKIQHTVLRVFIGLDHLVYRALCEGFVEILGGGEMVCVEVTLVHHEKVQDYQKAHGRHRNPLALPFHLDYHHQGSGKADEQEGTDYIGLEKGYAVHDEGVHQGILHLGIRAPGKAAEKARSQPGQRTEAARKAQGPHKALPEGVLVQFFLYQLVQGEEAQHRQAHLQHHQRHGHRSELVIKRQDIVAELGKGHKMASYGHQDGQNGSSQQPPFFLSPVQEQAQNKEEHADGTHIHGTGCKGLGTPVERQVLGGFLEVLLPGPLKELDGLRLVGVYRAGRCAAVKVGDHQVGQFLPAIAPGCGIIQVQALLAAAVLGQFGAAAHGIRRVFGQRKQLVGVGGYARHAQHQQEGRCHHKRLPGLSPDGLHQLHDGIDKHHNGQVIRDLLVVGLDLETERNAKQGCAQERFPNVFGILIRIYQCRQDPGHEGDGLHLGVVTHLDNL